MISHRVLIGLHLRFVTITKQSSGDNWISDFKMDFKKDIELSDSSD